MIASQIILQAVRNFVQLCMEGYYDNTIFHRIIRDYMAQGGDPTGKGTGTERHVNLIVFTELVLHFRHPNVVKA